VPFLGPGGRFGFGFGIVSEPKPGGRLAGAFGWGGAYGTTFWGDPTSRLSVIIFGNVAGGTPLGEQIEQAIYAP
jgi:CubicO group peptidase (beta-lactamase class C family)